MLYKKITDDNGERSGIVYFNNREGLKLRAYSSEYSEYETEVYLTLNDIDSLIELKKDIEKQLDFRLDIQKEKRLNESKKQLKKTK